MKSRVLLLFLTLTAAFKFVLGDAQAHPHVWITASSNVVFNDAGLIIAIKSDWVLDEAYSAVATEGLDANNDGTLDSSELAPLTAENIDSLKDYDYFTYAFRANEKVVFDPPREARQSMQGKNLALHFELPLSQPINPKEEAFTFRVYDPTFYIAISLLNPNPIQLTSAPPGCSPSVNAPDSTEATESTKQMLADQPADWQSPVPENFGVLFADIIAVTCN